MRQYIPRITCILLGGWLAACSNSATSTEGNRNPSATPKTAAARHNGEPPPPKTTAAKPATGNTASPAPAAARSSMPQPGGQQHPVFDLTDNRALAHLSRDGGLFIALGHPGMAKHVNFNRPWGTWELNRTLEGKRVALADRTVSWLNFPLTAQQAKSATELALHLKAAKAQGLRVLLNERRLDNLRLSGDWQTVKLSVPAGTARAGENRLELRWGARGRIQGVRTAAAVEWLYLGPKAPQTVTRVQPDVGGKLVLPRGGGLAYYVRPYPGTQLELSFKAQPPKSRCTVQVRALSRKGQALQQSRSETALAPGSLATTVVDLGPIAGQVARLELTAQGASCTELLLQSAALVRPGPAPQVKRAKAPTNVLFWMIDNARADRYSLYNPKTRVKTPVIEQLGKSGTVYAKAYMQGTESRVSHASLWTSLYPKQHHFVDPKAKLNRGWTTLPEALKAQGLYTAAWIANGFVSKFWGFAQGWSQFRNTLHKGGGLTGKRLADHAIEFINEKGGEPFYLYIGTIDPHVSWRGRQPWLKEYYPEPYNGPFKKNVMGKTAEKIATGKMHISAADKKRIVAIYDSTVSYNDHHLGRVLEALDKKGIREQTMVVITADHGEELWDFGRIGHGHSLRHSLVAVPLIIYYPPLFGSGVRVEQGVDVLSLMPTILDALGAKLPETVQGESLLPLAQGVGTGYPRPSIATQYELAHTIRLENYKLWVGGKGKARVYDLASKAGEHKEISADVPLATRWLTDCLSTFKTYQRFWRASRWGVASNQTAALVHDLESGTAKPIKP